jgi:hypothetical protein
MAKRIRCFARRFLFSTMIVAISATSAIGQINDPSVKPENIDLLPAKRPIVEYALAGGFLLAALAIGFKPAKRAGNE